MRRVLCFFFYSFPDLRPVTGENTGREKIYSRRKVMALNGGHYEKE